MGAVDILRLKPAFTDEQAEALARLIDENLATNHDIAAVQRDIEALRKELRSDIETTRAELRLEIERLGGDVENGRNDLIGGSWASAWLSLACWAH